LSAFFINILYNFHLLSGEIELKIIIFVSGILSKILEISSSNSGFLFLEFTGILSIMINFFSHINQGVIKSPKI
jgi:hypothetical protein